MLKATRTAITALISSDSTIPAERGQMAIAVLDGRGDAGGEPADLDRAITRKEAARLLGVHPKTVSSMARRGLIRRLVYSAGGERASRFSLRSVQALLDGKARGSEVAE